MSNLLIKMGREVRLYPSEHPCSDINTQYEFTARQIEAWRRKHEPFVLETTAALDEAKNKRK